MKIFISGGCKNGKSIYAQKLAKKMQKAEGPLYYLATMVPSDDEDRKRILKHQEERHGWGFDTVAAAYNIYSVISKCSLKGSFLLDSVTALLANEMFTKNGDIIMGAYKKVSDELTASLNITENIVIISDYIYSDAFIYDKLTEQYRFGLAFIDKEMAKACDIVIEVCYGNLLIYKGAGIFEKLYF